MTDADLPATTPEEELAAAVLDGEATAAEQARAQEPAVAAALAAQRRAAEALAAAPAVDDDGRERAIAAALGAWDADVALDATDDLARRRAQRASRLLPALGAAAAVVVALVLGGLALRDGDADDEAASSEAFESTGEDLDADRGEAAADAPAAAGGSSDLAASVAFGDFRDLDALLVEVGEVAAAARNASGGDAEGAEESAEAPVSSPAAGVADAGAGAGAGGGSSPDVTCAAPPLPPGTYVTGGPATVEGRPVTVTVVDGPDGTVVQVVDLASCDVLYEGPPG